MAEYIDIDIEDDPAVLTEQITDVIAAAIPNWVPLRTALIYLLAAGTALIIAELMQAMRTLTRAIFSIFGREVAGVAQTEATPSTATATFTSNTAAFTVEAGTLVGIDDGAGGLIAFEVVADVSTVDGSAENVQLVSQEAGAHTAGLTDAVPLDALDYDPEITITGALGTPVTLATSSAGDDIIDTATAHGFAAGDVVQFSTLTGGAGLTAATRDYYVIAANLAAQTFQVSETVGGGAVNFTTNITAGTVAKRGTATTLGGTDAETDDDYLPRLSERLQLLADRVIRGQDAAILARQVTGVHRALAVDNFEPPADDTAEGHITVALQAEDGGAVTAPVATAVQELLDASSILGLTINLVDVESEQVKVTVTGVAFAGYDETDVQDRVEAAIESFLDPATWGTLPFGDVREWRTQLTVRYLELAQVINAVEGFDYISTLTLALEAGVLGTSDVTLGSEPWVVAAPGTISVTVNPPA